MGGKGGAASVSEEYRFEWRFEVIQMPAIIGKHTGNWRGSGKREREIELRRNT